MTVDVLLVNAGRRGELVDLLRAAGGGRVVAVDIDALAPALYRADRGERVPPVADPAFVPRLAELCAEHGIGLVVPTTDRELPVLSERAAELEAAGARVAVGTPDAVAAALDKLDCATRLAAAGLAAVPTVAWPRDGAPPFGLPVVVKPRRGSASEGVAVVRDAARWTPPPEPEGWIVQPFAPGPEVTIDVLATGAGAVLGLGARERLKVRGGEVERGRTVPAEPFLGLAQGVARALSLAGAFNFQVFVGTGTPVVGEVNPRVGGGLPLAEHAGAAILDGLCAWAADGRWPDREVRFARPGVAMARYDRSVFLEPDEPLWR